MRVVAEAKGLALMDLDSMQGIAQNGFGKAPRRPLAQLIVEGQNQHKIETRSGDRMNNMRTFSIAALELLEKAIG